MGDSTRDVLNGGTFPEELHLLSAEKRQQQSMNCMLNICENFVERRVISL